MAYERGVLRFRKTCRNDSSSEQVQHDTEVVFAGICLNGCDVAEPSHIRSLLGKSPSEYVCTITRPIGWAFAFPLWRDRPRRNFPKQFQYFSLAYRESLRNQPLPNFLRSQPFRSITADFPNCRRQFEIVLFVGCHLRSTQGVVVQIRLPDFQQAANKVGAISLQKRLCARNPDRFRHFRKTQFTLKKSQFCLRLLKLLSKLSAFPINLLEAY